MARVLIAAVKPWNVARYRRWAAAGRHRSTLVERPEDLTPSAVEAYAPDLIFVPHWSWRIPTAIHERFECIGFHMTDLPFGRGGSPLQNLILRKLAATQVSAFRVTGEMDAGPIYLKRPLSLDGSAGDIYARAADIVFDMIDEILERRPVPVPQRGSVVGFQRRTPAESEITGGMNARDLYDFIRMLDAETYPPAFLIHAGLRYEFRCAVLRGGRVEAQVSVAPAEKETA